MSYLRSDNGKEDIAFLHKPFSMQQLSAKVREVLDWDKHATAAKTVIVEAKGGL
jgi:DNA-binding response OmpR family regulator